MKMRFTGKKLFLAVVLLLLYLAILIPFQAMMQRRPFAEKLGLIPRPEVLKVLAPDFQNLLGASILNRVVFYFGALVGYYDDPRNLARSADYPAMSRAIHAAVKLDPYNMDAYYFGQAILVWDVAQYRLATDLLEYGMKYRTWDWQLPFFAGFNQAFFLHDRAAAARMYMKAGELSGNVMFKTLAGRYLQEVGETQMAITYLSAQLESATNPGIKKMLQVRIQAFRAVAMIEQARDSFLQDLGRMPASLAELLETGYLKSLPTDPYGGKFYLTAEKAVRTTSKFSFALGRSFQSERKGDSGRNDRP